MTPWFILSPKARGKWIGTGWERINTDVFYFLCENNDELDSIMEISSDAVVLTVSQFNSYINELVSIQPVLVEGEVSNYRPISGRNFCYFDIKDSKAVAKCFQGFWNSEKAALENGTNIRVFGFPSMQKNGSFVIDVREIILSGKGALMEAYLKIRDKLEKEGLFDPERKKQLPVFSKKIGLIAGKNSSAYHDVAAELSERWKGLKIIFHPSRVQGIGAKKEIVGAIRYFNQKCPVDVLIVARGGGSMEDLQAFDSEQVVREIFASKIPIVSAIGHEDHWTLSDYVSDVRAKTPTKAAQIAVPEISEIEQRLDYFLSRTESLLRFQIDSEKKRLDNYDESMARIVKQKIKEGVFFLENSCLKLKSALDGQIKEKAKDISNLEKHLLVLNPLGVLGRGYAALEKEGKKIESIRQIAKGEEFRAILQDGGFDAIVK